MSKPVLFISDLHLDPARPEITSLFLQFLDQRAMGAEGLYILGDLFEAWLGDDHLSEHNRQVIAGLKRVADAGVPVFFMHGNRDFLVGAEFAAMTGATLLPDPAVVKLFGTPTLLMHGDLLCTGDVDYQRFRKLVRAPEWQAEFLAKPIAERVRVVQGLRQTSREATSAKAEQIMDVDPETVGRTMREHGLLQLIHGHTHRPAIHELTIDGQAGRRIVLGDWYEQGSVLCYEQSGFRLESLGDGAV